MSYRFVKITSFYREYLEYYYNRYPDIRNKSYNEQLQHLMDQEFAWSNYYQKNLNTLGADAYEIICNARHLQDAWAKENGFKQNGKALILEQLRKIQPEVVFFQDSSLFNGEWIKHLREHIPSIKKIIGFRCSPYSKELAESFKYFDFMIVCSEMFVEDLSKYGYKIYELNHAFENSIITKITNNNTQAESDLIFIGSILSGKLAHNQRKKTIETIINNKLGLKLYGNIPEISTTDLRKRQVAYVSVKTLKMIGLKGLVRHLPFLNKAINLYSMPEKNNIPENISKLILPPVYGLEMYQLLNKSKVTFNMHGDGAGNSAANIRIFEATGSGSCLLTDWKPNMKNFFEDGKEIVTFKNEAECIEKARWLIEHDKEREEIALNGQKRTLTEHTYYNRAIKLNQIILEELKKI